MKSENFLNGVSLTLLICLTALIGGLYYLEIINVIVSVGAFILSVYISYSIQIADQWEKAVVLRMGKFTGLKGPGFFLIIPIIDHIDKYIDQRVRVTDIKAEETLTKDTVPVNVDAVVYWTVWDLSLIHISEPTRLGMISYAVF